MGGRPRQCRGDAQRRPPRLPGCTDVAAGDEATTPRRFVLPPGSRSCARQRAGVHYGRDLVCRHWHRRPSKRASSCSTLSRGSARTDRAPRATASLGADVRALDVNRPDGLEAGSSGRFSWPTAVRGVGPRRVRLARHGLSRREFEPRSAGLPSLGAKGFIDNGRRGRWEGGQPAEPTYQDSMLPVRVGDRSCARGSSRTYEGWSGNVARRAREAPCVRSAARAASRERSRL